MRQLNILFSHDEYLKLRTLYLLCQEPMLDVRFLIQAEGTEYTEEFTLHVNQIVLMDPEYRDGLLSLLARDRALNYRLPKADAYRVTVAPDQVPEPSTYLPHL